MRATNADGVAWAWWCMVDGTPRISTVAALSSFVPAWPASSPSSAAGLLAALWSSNVKSGANPILDGLAWSAYQAALPNKPAAVPWLVAPNGTATTRPAYELRDGKLYTSAARAKVGDPCDLARGKFANVSAVYGAIPQAASAASAPVLVAICKPK